LIFYDLQGRIIKPGDPRVSRVVFAAVVGRDPDTGRLAAESLSPEDRATVGLTDEQGKQLPSVPKAQRFSEFDSSVLENFPDEFKSEFLDRLERQPLIKNGLERVFTWQAPPAGGLDRWFSFMNDLFNDLRKSVRDHSRWGFDGRVVVEFPDGTMKALPFYTGHIDTRWFYRITAGKTFRWIYGREDDSNSPSQKEMVMRIVYAAVAKALAAEGLVTMSSMRRTARRPENKGKKPQDWKDARGNAWEGWDYTGVKVRQIDVKPMRHLY
jgi:hypothetical protein